MEQKQKPVSHGKPPFTFQNPLSKPTIPVAPIRPIRRAVHSHSSTPGPRFQNPNRSHFMRTPIIPPDVLKRRLDESCFYKPEPKGSPPKRNLSNGSPTKIQKLDTTAMDAVISRAKENAEGVDLDLEHLLNMGNLSLDDDKSKSDLDTTESSKPNSRTVVVDKEEDTLVIFRSSKYDLMRIKKAMASGEKLRMPGDPEEEPESPTPSAFTKSEELTPTQLEHLEQRHNPKMCTRQVVRQSEEEYKKNMNDWKENERRRREKRRQNKFGRYNPLG